MNLHTSIHQEYGQDSVRLVYEEMSNEKRKEGFTGVRIGQTVGKLRNLSKKKCDLETKVHNVLLWRENDVIRFVAQVQKEEFTKVKDRQIAKFSRLEDKLHQNPTPKDSTKDLRTKDTTAFDCIKRWVTYKLFKMHPIGFGALSSTPSHSQ